MHDGKTRLSEPDAAPASQLQRVKYSTADLPVNERQEWLREVIGREYANVEITPPSDGGLFNEMIIYSWEDMRLSVIRSNEITLERLPREPHLISQDVYFAVVHLSGDYRLQQDGREVFLRPGDMVLYDATLPHRIRCPRQFSKLIISIPRPLLRERIAGIEYCTALRVPGDSGIGKVAAELIRCSASQAENLNNREFSTLSGCCLDLLTQALAAVRPAKFDLSASRAFALHRVKHFIEQHLAQPELNPAMVAGRTGMSPRYINRLFQDQDTSLMRYILRRRLEQCRQDLRDPLHAGHRISDIAFRWGFNDLAHFSRVFRRRYGCSPKEYRESV